MKKLLVLILALTVCLALFACGGGEDPTCTEHIDADSNGKCDSCGATVEPEDDGGKTDEDLVLVTDSVTGFAIVCANSLSDKATGYVIDFMNTLNRYYLEDGNLKQNYDAPGFDDAVEVIFGAPKNRGDAFIKDEHYLGYKGFSIELIGNKLFVLGGGDRGYQEAIKYLEDTLFDLESYGEEAIDELVIPKGTKYESIPTNYDITNFTIDGNDANEYVLTYTASSKVAKSAATTLQNAIYKGAGIWLPYVALKDVTNEQKVIYVEFTKGDKERRTDDGCTVYVKDGDLHIECEFENKFEDIMYSFIDDKLSSEKVTFSKTYTFSKDVRNIYYKDFGAKGNGEADDFYAIKACHDEANKWGHTVNAEEGATYYIGKENGTDSIIVKTDTYLNCCTFIWDDRVLPDPSESKAYLSPIYQIAPSESSYSLSGSSLPVKSLASGATSIENFAPGKRVLVLIYDNTKRHYIRFGGNQNNGTAQKEIIIVNADGTIDPTTPVQWDYSTLSKMEIYHIDEEPLVFSGGRKGQINNYGALGTFDNFDCIDRTTIHTIFNDAPSEYKYHNRNIEVRRSNVTVQNFEHILDDNVEHSAPYGGFVNVVYATDIVVDGMVFQKQRAFSTTGAGGNVSMGSYEIHADYANNVTWQNCRQSNFFQPNGSVIYNGYMATNYCKNLVFDNMTSCSFDSHCGLYNGTIKNSTVEHLNFIGGGLCKLENVTVYTDGANAAICLREDYGSIWDGEVIIDGLVMKTSKENVTLSVMRAYWTNHDFGYTCYLPERVSINNAKIVHYGYKVENEVRSEWKIKENHVPLHLYANLELYTGADISDPYSIVEKYPNDYKKCNCHEVYNGTKSFNDTDGDGRCNNDLNPNDTYTVWCWGFEDHPNKAINANPYIPTKEVYLTNCGNLKFIVPSTLQFYDTVLYIDGTLQKKN